MSNISKKIQRQKEKAAKKELQKKHDDLLAKINEGKQAIKNMETSLIGLQGAIQQCGWTLERLKEEKKK